jgi:hypothetical protein
MFAPATATGFWSRLVDQPGLLLKRLVLVGGGMYLAFVAVTNTVNFIVTVGGFHWTFLNSGNVVYIASITKVYSWPSWINDGVVLLAALGEGFGAFLFARALHRYAGGAAGVRSVWLALCWNIAIWLGFIAGTEFFVAYQSEGPFRELLAIGLLMPVIIAVVPDCVPGAGAGVAAAPAPVPAAEEPTPVTDDRSGS